MNRRFYLACCSSLPSRLTSADMGSQLWNSSSLLWSFIPITERYSLHATLDLTPRKKILSPPKRTDETDETPPLRLSHPLESR